MSRISRLALLVLLVCSAIHTTSAQAAQLDPMEAKLAVHHEGVIKDIPEVVLPDLTEPDWTVESLTTGTDGKVLTWEQSISKFTRLRFVSAFITSISMILVSEVGDKTFFIAAIMAMKHSRNQVFTAAMAALAIMTVLSAAMGFTLPSLLPPDITHYFAIVLFLYFGVKLLYDAYQMPASQPSDELEEVEEELQKLDSNESADRLESGGVDSTDKQRRNCFSNLMNRMFSRVFIQVFTMTFLAEWGDRSQIATIALAAAKDPVGVSVGAVIGHCMCTGLAVVGGKLLAAKISERTVATVGGALFLVFALHSVVYGE